MRNLLIGLCLFGLSSVPVLAGSLPESVKAALRQAHIPLSSVAVVVQEEHGKLPIISLNAGQAMNPASTMKLLTTFAALETLGPAYRWNTEAYLDGKLENGVLQGDLVFKGYGDPKLTVEQFWMWLRELRQRGLREIRGDVVLDHSFFAAMNQDPGEFDHDPTRAYNVEPNALLLNFNALHLHLVPDGNATIALMEPDLAGYTVQNHITTSAKLDCNGEDDYKARLDGHDIVLEGAIPAACGEADDYFSLLPQDEYFFAVFSALWHELGGTLQGKLREGTVSAGQVPFSRYVSPPLAEVVRDINKFSNNIMARQLFLTLGTTGATNDATAPHASIAQSIAALQQWLKAQQLHFPELVLENGAGLSRKARISARHLAELLQHATRSPFYPELESSLPILGMDGTVKKRFDDSEIAGYAHLKTGSLEGVKSIAGYVKARSGRQWIVVFIVNDPNAALAQPAQDALLEWLQTRH